MSAPVTADGVEIVVGMTVWFADEDDLSTFLSMVVARLTATCVVDDPLPGRGNYIKTDWCYSTRTAAIAARLAELKAEVERLERMLRDAE